MKYRKIYDVIRHHPVKSVTDISGWSIHPSIAVSPYPLWLIIETMQNIRIWVSHSSGEFGLSYADMSIPTKERAYSESLRRIEVRNQSETAHELLKLLTATKEELYGKVVIGKDDKNEQNNMYKRSSEGGRPGHINTD